MRKVLMFLFAGAVSLASAQDGLYGSFLVGQKFIDFNEMNAQIASKLTDYQIPPELFPSNHWTFGGEGHLILAKRLVLGGKAFGIMYEKTLVPVSSTPEFERRIRMTGAMGVGTVGFNLLGENRFGMHLYPQLGLGASSFVYQSKRKHLDEAENEANKQFDVVLVETQDYMETLAKFGLIVDLAAGFDWYKPFKQFFTIVPGLDFGLLFHAEVGYLLLPGGANLKWRRDFDLKGKDQVEGGPDLKFDGFYFNIGFGIGLTAES